jgi:hypothetical protein
LDCIFHHKLHRKGHPHIMHPVLALQVVHPNSVRSGVVVGRCTLCKKPYDDYGSRHRCIQCRMLILLCPTCARASSQHLSGKSDPGTAAHGGESHAAGKVAARMEAMRPASAAALDRQHADWDDQGQLHPSEVEQLPRILCDLCQDRRVAVPGHPSVSCEIVWSPLPCCDDSALMWPS